MVAYLAGQPRDKVALMMASGPDIPVQLAEDVRTLNEQQSFIGSTPLTVGAWRTQCENILNVALGADQSLEVNNGQLLTALKLNGKIIRSVPIHSMNDNLTSLVISLMTIRDVQNRPRRENEGYTVSDVKNMQIMK